MSIESIEIDEETRKPLFVDKRKMRQTLKKMYARIGFVPDYSATPRQVRDHMVAEGVTPKDNSASREMIALRYPDEDTTAPGWE